MSLSSARLKQRLHCILYRQFSLFGMEAITGQCVLPMFLSSVPKPGKRMLMLKSCKEDVLLECQLDAEPGLLCAFCVCCRKVAQTLHPCGTLHYRRDGAQSRNGLKFLFSIDPTTWSTAHEVHCCDSAEPVNHIAGKLCSYRTWFGELAEKSITCFRVMWITIN